MTRRPIFAVSIADVLIVTALCFGMFILSSIQAVASGFPTPPFTDAMFFNIIAYEICFAAAALGYLHLRGHDLGHLIPSPSYTGSIAGAVLFVAATAAAWVLESLFGSNSAATQPVDAMVAHATISFGPLLGLSLVNGLYEETFLVGFLQRALETSGASFAVGTSLLVRVSYHLYQGPVGAVSILGFGMILSLYYMRTRKLWPLVSAHILADFTAFSMA
ncbi:MAG TPA: CPBP family intramembrane glutamic endopeptidase [Gallionellaceae bacterium]